MADLKTAHRTVFLLIIIMADTYIQPRKSNVIITTDIRTNKKADESILKVYQEISTINKKSSFLVLHDQPLPIIKGWEVSENNRLPTRIRW